MEESPPSPPAFAAGLLTAVVVVALLAELAWGVVAGDAVSLRAALTNAVLVGGVFAVIYVLGSAVAARWFDGGT